MAFVQSWFEVLKSELFSSVKKESPPPRAKPRSFFNVRSMFLSSLGRQKLNHYDESIDEEATLICE